MEAPISKLIWKVIYVIYPFFKAEIVTVTAKQKVLARKWVNRLDRTLRVEIKYFKITLGSQGFWRKGLYQTICMDQLFVFSYFSYLAARNVLWTMTLHLTFLQHWGGRWWLNLNQNLNISFNTCSRTITESLLVIWWFCHKYHNNNENFLLHVLKLCLSQLYKGSEYMVNDVHGVQGHVENEMLHLKESQICLNLQPPVWSVVHHSTVTLCATGHWVIESHANDMRMLHYNHIHVCMNQTGCI